MLPAHWLRWICVCSFDLLPLLLDTPQTNRAYNSYSHNCWRIRTASLLFLCCCMFIHTLSAFPTIHLPQSRSLSRVPSEASAISSNKNVLTNQSILFSDQSPIIYSQPLTGALISARYPNYGGKKFDNHTFQSCPNMCSSPMGPVML